MGIARLPTQRPWRCVSETVTVKASRERYAFIGIVLGVIRFYIESIDITGFMQRNCWLAGLLWMPFQVV